MIQLTKNKINHTEITESVRSHNAGAVILFLGTVREMTEGKRTLALDYDAYSEMAEVKLTELEKLAFEQWKITKVTIVHRLGHLDLGDISVAVAVSSPHRGDSFEAGRFIIDRLKETVPIWKKEHWEDGSTEWIHPQ